MLGKDHPQLVYPGWGCEGELAASFPAEGPADLQEGVRFKLCAQRWRKGTSPFQRKKPFWSQHVKAICKFLLLLSSNQGALSHHSATPCFAGSYVFIKE